MVPHDSKRDLPLPMYLTFLNPTKGRSGPSDSRSLQTGVLSTVTSSSGMQVTGKDRALFFRRPVLQMSYVMPLPHIRYTRELSLSVDDLAKNDERRKHRQRQLDQHNNRGYSSTQHMHKSTPDYFQERSFSGNQHHRQVRDLHATFWPLILYFPSFLILYIGS